MDGFSNRDQSTRLGAYPGYRPRRMRQSEKHRRLIRETTWSLDQCVMPYFIQEGVGVKEPIESMPGQHRFSIDTLLYELEELLKLKVRSILLFGNPSHKDRKATGAWPKGGIVQKALGEIKKNFDDLFVMTDVCLCAYTDHGHCGVLDAEGNIENDATLKLLSEIAISHAEAGSDMVAPSDMMDGRVRAIRRSLDRKGFQNTALLSYAAKFASAFYGPFRDAANSAPSSGDRKSYQMDSSNLKEALREIAQDIQEGADMVMVKPALSYLDVIREASRLFHFPIAAYSVSGEYAMIKSAHQRGFLDERAIVAETMTSFARAGASVFITYYTKQIAEWQASKSEFVTYSDIST